MANESVLESDEYHDRIAGLIALCALIVFIVGSHVYYAIFHEVAVDNPVICVMYLGVVFLALVINALIAARKAKRQQTPPV